MTQGEGKGKGASTARKGASASASASASESAPAASPAQPMKEEGDTEGKEAAATPPEEVGAEPTEPGEQTHKGSGFWLRVVGASCAFQGFGCG